MITVAGLYRAVALRELAAAEARVVALAQVLAASNPQSDPDGRDLDFYADQARSVIAALPGLGFLHIDHAVRVADDCGMTADRPGNYARGQRVMALRIISALRDELAPQPADL
jgi:hypothetical protein